MTLQFNNGLTTPFCWVRFCVQICLCSIHPWIITWGCGSRYTQQRLSPAAVAQFCSLLMGRSWALYSCLCSWPWPSSGFFSPFCSKTSCSFVLPRSPWLNVFFKLNVCEILTVNYTYYRVVLPLFLSLIFLARLKLLANALILIFFYDIT